MPKKFSIYMNNRNSFFIMKNLLLKQKVFSVKEGQLQRFSQPSLKGWFCENHLIIMLFVFLMPLSIWGYSESVYSGIKKIEVSKNQFLEIESYFQNGCDRENDLCLPSNRLFLVTKTKKIDHSDIISSWNNYTFVYFVKISKDKYLYDLDKDGTSEFALYPMIAGNNPVTDAYIYSVSEDKITHYGMGKFHFEQGPHVKGIEKGKWTRPHL